MSRDDFVSYASEKYSEIPRDDRPALAKQWAAEIADFNLNLDADSSEGQDHHGQDTHNQRSGRELELVKSQLLNMVSP